jgi:hypothetical protein
MHLGSNLFFCVACVEGAISASVLHCIFSYLILNSFLFLNLTSLGLPLTNNKLCFNPYFKLSYLEGLG